MAGFLYFLPNLQKTPVDTAAAARAQGLDWILDGDESNQVESREIYANGPDPSRGGGRLVFDPRRTPNAKVEPNNPAQVWRRVPECLATRGPVWIGRWTDRPVDLAAYARKEVIDGATVRLDDGQQLTLPTAKQYFDVSEEGRFVYRVGLPTLLDVADDGRQIVGTVVRRHQRLWAMVERYESAIAQIVAEEDPIARDRLQEQLWPVGSEVLLFHEIVKTNYRFGLAELLALNLYDVALRNRAFEIVLDEDGFRRLQKKMGETREYGNTYGGDDPLTAEPTQAGQP